MQREITPQNDQFSPFNPQPSVRKKSAGRSCSTEKKLVELAIARLSLLHSASSRLETDSCELKHVIASSADPLFGLKLRAQQKYLY